MLIGVLFGYSIKYYTNDITTDINDGSWQLAKIKIKLGADINKTNLYGETPLIASVRAGNQDLALYLLNNGADPYMDIHLYMRLIGQKGMEKLFENIVKTKDNRLRLGFLHISVCEAVYEGNIDFVKNCENYIELTSVRNAFDQNLLIIAARRKNVELLRTFRLKFSDEDFSYKDKFGKSALDYLNDSELSRATSSGKE